MGRVTTQITCGTISRSATTPLRAHATQIDPNGVFRSTLGWQQRLWPTEEFELAKTRVTTSIPETDLFTGIEGMMSPTMMIVATHATMLLAAPTPTQRGRSSAKPRRSACW